MEDIAPQLLEAIAKDFRSSYEASGKIRSLLQKVKENTATFTQAQEYALEVSRLIGLAYEQNVSSAVLPDGRMYYNIASRLLPENLDENYRLVSQYAAGVQKSLNEKAGIGMKAQIPEKNEDRIRGIVEVAANAEQYDDIAGLLPGIFDNFCQNVVDETIKANVNFQGKAGLVPKILRRAERKCCAWCNNLAGEYRYPNVPEDVYRRHENCRCQVDYDPGSGKLQNVHTKQWKTPEDYDKIETRKAFSASNNAKPVVHKDTTVADALANGVVKDAINLDKQEKHIFTSPNYEAGKSYIYGELADTQMLYDQLKGTGEPVYGSDRNWLNKERVSSDRTIGVWIDKNGEKFESSSAMIVYSKTGSHIYPRKEEK